MDILFKELDLTQTSVLQDSPAEILIKKRIYKNIIVMCCGVFLLLTACEGPNMLQSTMNKKEGIGVTQSAVLYGMYCITGLLCPKYIIKRFGSKRTFTAAMVVYTLVLTGNAYPVWSVMIPFAILGGIAAPLLWTAQESYINAVSVRLAIFGKSEEDNIEDSLHMRKNSESPVSSHNTSESNLSDFAKKYSSTEVGAVTKRNLSYDCSPEHFCEGTLVEYPKTSFVNEGFSMEGDTENIPVENSTTAATNIVQFSSIQTPSESDLLMTKNKTETITARVFGIHGMSILSCHLWGNLLSHFVLNSSDDPNYLYNETNSVCGYNYCGATNNETSRLTETHADISDETRYTLIGVSVAIAAFSVILVALLLDPLKEKDEQNSLSFGLLKATFSVAKRCDSLLLIPSSFYIGLLQAFYAGDYTKAYVSCAWDTYHVSLVSVCYGLFCVIAAISSGWLVNLLGRVFVYTFIVLLNTALCTVLLLWNPDASNPAMFFVAAGMMGTYIGVAYSQHRAFYGILFKEEKEAAFGAFHVWYSLGFTVAFACSNHFCTYVKIYFLLIVSILGYLFYLIVERNYSLKKSKT